ncbi:MAG: threonine--tRNA ligase, partial [Ignavibacteriales bacterium]|nr:threonine--tRNA ligase [Ignavibacteriales bacterium]
WQMSTVQFDFNLPERFDLKYIGEDGKEHRPFMVHRALLGSIERFMGVLIEHYGGDFPVWFAPTQVVIIPVSENLIEYCEEIKKELLLNEIRVKLDYRNEKIGYKIRDWEMQKIPYMLIIGEKEKSNEKISVRRHKVGDLGSKNLSDFLFELKNEINNKIINN